MILTEPMILSRAKVPSLDNIKQLNLCGYNLTDVSIVSKLTCIEVLALSVNNIASLESFRNCKRLRELYLRRNGITDIRQLFHLQGLTFLTNLWLIENPFCAKLGPNYRAVILNILPHLQILDNEPVTREEIEQSRYMNIEYEGQDYEESSQSDTTGDDMPPSIGYDCEDMKENRSTVLNSIFALVRQLDLQGLEVLHKTVGHRINRLLDEGDK